MLLMPARLQYSHSSQESVVTCDFFFDPSASSFSFPDMMIISLKKVCGDFMVLESPPPCPPVDPDDVSALTQKNIQWISLNKVFGDFMVLESTEFNVRP